MTSSSYTDFSLFDAFATELPDPADSAQTESARSLLQAVALFEGLAPYNAVALLLQRPQATHVETRRRWEELGRRPEADERPEMILMPGAPLLPVYDIAQTCPIVGAEAGLAADPQGEQRGLFSRPVDHRRLATRFMRGLPDLGIAVDPELSRDPDELGLGGGYFVTRRLDYPDLVSVPNKSRLRGVVLEMAPTPDWERLTPSRRLWELMVAAGRLQVQLPLLRRARNRYRPERVPDESASAPRTSRGERAQENQDRQWSLLCVAARRGHETRSPEAAEFAAQIAAWLALTRAGYGEVAPAGNIAQQFLAGDIETAPEGEMMAEICVVAHELAGPLERGEFSGAFTFDEETPRA